MLLRGALGALLLVGCQTETKKAPPDEKARAKAIAKVAGPGKIAVGCVGGDAIDAPAREEIIGVARQGYDQLRSGDLDALWASLHPQARREDQHKAFSEAMRGAAQRVNSAQGDPQLEHVHFVDVKGGVSKLAKIQCGDKNDPAAFELVANAGNEDIAVITFVTAGSPFAFATTLQLRRRGPAWKLLGLQAGPAGYRGKGADAFEAEGESLTRQQKFVPGYLALAVAQQLAARGSAIKPVRQARIDEKLASLEKSELFKAELGAWSVGAKTYEVAGISLASTQSDLSPVIKYVTPGGLIRDILDAEADQLLGHVKSRYPELARSFDAVVFEAYAEPPTEPNRQYDAYRIARYFDPAKRPG